MQTQVVLVSAVVASLIQETQAHYLGFFGFVALGAVYGIYRVHWAGAPALSSLSFLEKVATRVLTSLPFGTQVKIASLSGAGTLNKPSTPKMLESPKLLNSGTFPATQAFLGAPCDPCWATWLEKGGFRRMLP